MGCNRKTKDCENCSTKATCSMNQGSQLDGDMKKIMEKLKAGENPFESGEIDVVGLTLDMLMKGMEASMKVMELSSILSAIVLALGKEIGMDKWQLIVSKETRKKYDELGRRSSTGQEPPFALSLDSDDKGLILTVKQPTEEEIRRSREG